MSPRRLYLDNSATSFPKPPAVLEAMTQYATALGASPGRGAYEESLQTGKLLDQCRSRLAELFNAEDPRHIVFTLNCSDALNLAIKGLLTSNSQLATSNYHVICTHLDHNSILRPLNALQDAGVITQSRIPVDPLTGLVDPDDIRKAIRANTKLIALTHVSNVTGTVQPIREIGQMARRHDIPFLVDAAQSAGHLPIDVQADCIDLLAAPGHKALMGPLGTGLLYIRPGIERILTPLREGGTGSQSEQDRQPDFLPDKYEPGSHNAIGIIGLGAGAAWVLDQTVEKLHRHDQDLTRTFLDGINNIDGLRYYGPQGIKHRIGVFSVSVEGLSPADLSAALEKQFGILTRPGLHCAPLAHQTLGTTERGGTTRFSFGPFLSKQDIHFAANALADLATRSPVVSGSVR